MQNHTIEYPKRIFKIYKAIYHDFSTLSLKSKPSLTPIDISYRIFIVEIFFYMLFFIKDRSGVVNKNKQLINISEFKQVFINNKKLLINFIVKVIFKVKRKCR